ncbi:MAG: N-acetyltransferase [Myxococcales bacterium]|nr:N-acetyltransferase [Myxococcales bacterium]
MDVLVVSDLREVDPQAWDRLAGDDDPFAEHAFLLALEESGSVGADAGWLPVHLVVKDDAGRLVGALPLYLKEHSYGEYIFDWGWADAAARLGLEYYPKLVAMAPLTPATGTRVLVAPDAERARVVEALVAGLYELADQTSASSIHVLFVSDEERDDLVRASRALRGDEDALAPRLSMQYHWRAAGDRAFDDYLARFRSSDRKKVRKERRAVEAAGIEIRAREASSLDARDWSLLRSFYRDTCRRKGSYPYLTDEFFELGPARLGRALALMAYREGAPVAATLSFEKGRHLYGRYWGCVEDHEMLHFELCYYRLIERAIERGYTRFEAGAQGGHKLKRGLLPAPIHSVHWVRDPRLRFGVSDFLRREAAALRHQMDVLAAHSPFRAGDLPGGATEDERA